MLDCGYRCGHREEVEIVWEFRFGDLAHEFRTGKQIAHSKTRKSHRFRKCSEHYQILCAVEKVHRALSREFVIGFVDYDKPGKFFEQQFKILILQTASGRIVRRADYYKIRVLLNGGL